ncbi:MAG TPA: hypothetical protein VH722_04870 [Alphaproteobacteria bacterium]|jgi:hypothetical protein|nr:hypothetical protein [Alphaproteobacteria bacterium]
MNPNEMQIVLPVAIAIVIIALRAPRMMRPRKFRPAALWIGPVLVLAGAAMLMSVRPAPSAGHIAGMAAAFLLGCGLGVARAKLVRITFDTETGMLTQRGTPFGILLLVGLLIARSGLRLVAVDRPELGIDLNSATDLLLFFAFGLVGSYAVALSVVVGRLRRAG